MNVRSMNQGKLEVVTQEMARVNVNILGIRKSHDYQPSSITCLWNGAVGILVQEAGIYIRS